MYEIKCNWGSEEHLIFNRAYKLANLEFRRTLSPKSKPTNESRMRFVRNFIKEKYKFEFSVYNTYIEFIFETEHDHLLFLLKNDT